MRINKIPFLFYFVISLLLIISPLISFAQRGGNPTIPTKVNLVDCTESYLAGNLVFNPAFNTNTPFFDYSNPFGLGQVDYWSNAFSDANFETVFPQNTPLPNIHAAFMNSTYFGGGLVQSEGIVGKLSPLTTGQSYSLSFFLNYFEQAIPNASHAYNIYLMHCRDVTTYFPNPNSNPPLPAMPPNSQRIFCETNGGSMGWRHLTICFTADQDYDMMLIFPAVTPTLFTPNYTMSIGFAYPELLPQSTGSISINVTDNPLNDCFKTLSPSYAITNATYEWFLNGVSFSTLQNPQINATSQYGTISLEVTLPNDGTNSTCGSQNCLKLSAQIEIPLCQGCPNLPAHILPSSYFYWSTDWQHHYITQGSNNFFCIPWEDGIYLQLNSYYPSGNLWYLNDIPIPTSGVYQLPTNQYVQINNNTSGLLINGGGKLKLKIQVKNDASGCGILSPPTYLETIQIPYMFQNGANGNLIGNYKPNFNKHITSYPVIPSGYGELYTWDIPGTTITNQNPATSDADVYFPINITTPLVTGTLTISNSPYCNGVFPIYFTYDPNARISQVSTTIYPNPASNQLTITSTESITNIEISDLMNPTLKRIKVSSLKSTTINVADLKPGIYNCKISTSKGVENQKLVIRRN